MDKNAKTKNMAAICQSCAMPLTNEMEKYRGTNADNSTNSDYCIYCYKEGKFTDPDQTLQQAIDTNVEYAEQANMTKEQMRDYAEKILPTLKRWKQAA